MSVVVGHVFAAENASNKRQNDYVCTYLGSLWRALFYAWQPGAVWRLFCIFFLSSWKFVLFLVTWIYGFLLFPGEKTFVNSMRCAYQLVLNYDYVVWMAPCIFSLFCSRALCYLFGDCEVNFPYAAAYGFASYMSPGALQHVLILTAHISLLLVMKLYHFTPHWIGGINMSPLSLATATAFTY